HFPHVSRRFGGGRPEGIPGQRPGMIGVVAVWVGTRCLARWHARRDRHDPQTGVDPIAPLQGSTADRDTLLALYTIRPGPPGPEGRVRHHSATTPPGPVACAGAVTARVRHSRPGARFPGPLSSTGCSGGPATPGRPRIGPG